MDRFEIFGTQGRHFLCRRVGECCNGGGSIEIGNCLAKVTRDIIKTGVLNAEKCREILIHHAIPRGRQLIGEGFVLQQENCTCGPEVPAKQGGSWRPADDAVAL